jgi:hypothetical protein
MYFSYRATQEWDERMRKITEHLIEAALTCGGTYYLPAIALRCFEKIEPPKLKSGRAASSLSAALRITTSGSHGLARPTS